MEKYNDSTEMDKRQSLASSSASSYPPSPSYIPEQPAWANPSGSQTQSMRQRVLNLFDFQTSARLRGYALAPGTPNESGRPLPLYSPDGGMALHRLVRTPTQRKVFRIICLVLLIGVPYALFTSSTSTVATVKTGASPGDKAVEPASQPWFDADAKLPGTPPSPTQDKPAQAVSHNGLEDSQCLSVLEGGADAIICHVELAQRKFNAMMSRQSKTYEEAKARYVQQYNRQPPPGFEDWFKFAQQNKSPIIDDYGQLEKDLSPLRQYAPHILRQRMKSTREHDLYLMHQWDFVNGTLKSTAPEEWELVRTSREIMTPFLDKLPNFSVLQNWDDNMKVCGPKAGVEDLNEPNVKRFYRSGVPDAREYLSSGCPRNLVTDSNVTSDRPSVNMCTNYDDWEKQHGVTHMYGACINSTVPVLSLTRVSTFQDITTASWCYGNPNYRLNTFFKDEIPYSQKKTSLYWRGSNTGSRTDLQFAFQNQRARLIMMAHQMKHKATELAARVKTATPLTLTPADYNRINMPNMPTTFSNTQLSALSRLDATSIDMNFVDLHYCDALPKFCQEWKSTIPLAAHQPPQTAFQNKFLMDLDGNSMSCRFYRMLDSNSLVFKQTVYVEWHDDRIVPWLHYVPVSMSMEEIPVLVDFFANHEKGRLLGKMMADKSKEWAGSALRKVDLSVYTYRQMLELAHIIGHD
ncbi:related to capsule-associated protein-like protein [Sporisorium scitamineum]|uniref:Related to capsule-associated protein-like protein n=1 Tax=Sporisorium scitamineum TaxID=49012 RepID=A0A0F7RTZ0_9BASI|nr:hypothetical protein [Sporisorium scitamineum]CDU23476.1 related to capsule-associated protein-like protein [Sporisorium scitamineum]